MRILATITFAQYRDTIRAVVSAKDKRVQPRSWKENVALAIVGLALALALQVPVARAPVFTLFAVMILCWIFSKPIARRSQERCLKAIYSEERETLNGQVLTIDETGISCDRDHGQVSSHFAWQAFVKRIDMPDAFVFLQSPNSFVLVPKETLSSSDRELIWQWSSTVPTAGGG